MADMEMRALGGSGLRVSSLALGTMTFGGAGRHQAMGQVQVEEATAMVDASLEVGVNLFDTADVYSEGRSEEVLGKALGRRRHDVLVATKVQSPMRAEDGPNDRGQSRHHILRGCEESLRRLGTDYIDLYQVHSVDELTPMEETLRALDDLVRQGKVRYIGCSNYSAWHLMKALSISERHGWERYITHQAYYSLVGRDVEWELVPLCLDQDLGLLVWSPLAGGLLSGQQQRGERAPEGSRRAVLGDTGTVDYDQAFDIVDVLREIASEREVSVAQVALNWVRQRPAVSSVMVGARRQEQLLDNLRAATWSLTGDEMARLDQASVRPLPYPYWHQHKNNAARLAYHLQLP